MKDLLQFPSASNCSKTPVNLQSWELTPAQICLTRRLDCLSFTFSAELRPSHPHIHLFRRVCVCVCVRSPQTLEIPSSSTLCCSVLYFRLYFALSDHSYPSFNLLDPLLHPSIHAPQSSLSLSTSHIRSNPSPSFHPQEAPLPPSGYSSSFLFLIHPSVSLSLYQAESNVI